MQELIFAQLLHNMPHPCLEIIGPAGLPGQG
jgi:hypothetical protein